MPGLGERAVVLGASMGGLLAARVLSDFFRTVTVVDRDALPDDPGEGCRRVAIHISCWPAALKS
jgi:2-polyprenyl-6-methoxyphenol hydroxylase-like FAD-dependent oxidoreductase